MNDYAFFLLLGTGAGAMIAALALGLVITFQGSGVVNFAFGAMTMWVVYVYADLREGAYPFPIPGLPDRYHADRRRVLRVRGSREANASPWAVSEDVVSGSQAQVTDQPLCAMITGSATKPTIPLQSDHNVYLHSSTA